MIRSWLDRTELYCDWYVPVLTFERRCGGMEDVLELLEGSEAATGCLIALPRSLRERCAPGTSEERPEMLLFCRKSLSLRITLVCECLGLWSERR